MVPDFASFFQAGFECSSHRRRDGVGSTSSVRPATTGTCAGLPAVPEARVRNDPRRPALASDRKVAGQVRLVELDAGARGSGAAGVQVIWDLFHYGSPDHVDQAGGDFPARFTDFALAAIEVQRSVSGRAPIICPMNEINFLSWAVDDGYFPRVGPDQPAGSSDNSSAPRSGGKSDQAALAGADHRLGRALDPHRAARSPPGTVRAAEQNLRECSKLMTGSWAWPSRSLAATRRWST